MAVSWDTQTRACAPLANTSACLLSNHLRQWLRKCVQSAVVSFFFAWRCSHLSSHEQFHVGRMA